MRFDAIINELDEESVQDALRMTDEQKLRAGGDLFEYACVITLAGIRSEHPHFTHDEAFEELRRRIEEQDRHEDIE